MQLVHGACLSHLSFRRLHSRQLVISLFLRRIRGGAAGFDASCGVVLSRNTLRFGGDAFGDSLSPPVGDLSDGPGWYIQESDMVDIQGSSWRRGAGFTAVSRAGLTLAS